MKNDFFAKISLQCLLCLLIVVVSSGFNKASANKVTPAGGKIIENILSIAEKETTKKVNHK